MIPIEYRPTKAIKYDTKSADPLIPLTNAMDQLRKVIQEGQFKDDEIRRGDVAKNISYQSGERVDEDLSPRTRLLSEPPLPPDLRTIRSTPTSPKSNRNRYA